MEEDRKTGTRELALKFEEIRWTFFFKQTQIFRKQNEMSSECSGEVIEE